MVLEFINAKHKSWIVHGLFFAFFLSLSAINYSNFRLPALDQGIANQALYGYAHLNNAECTLLIGQPNAPYLSLHLSLWVPLLSPFYYLFGFYTLFIFQSLFIVFAGYCLQLIAKHYQLSNTSAILIVLQFYMCWAWIGAIADGYHENTIAACWVPFLYWSYLKANRTGIVLGSLGILICKENMAIWLFFLLPVLTIAAHQVKKMSWLTLMLMLISISYFYLATAIIMPELDPTHRFQQLNRYSHLGNDLTTIVKHVITHPLQMIELFFKSHVQPDDLENIKWELWIVLLLSGFWTTYANPVFIVAFLPLLAQKLWNKEVVFWGINYHYNVEFAPLLSLLAILFVCKFKTIQTRQMIALVLFVSTFIVSAIVLFDRKSIWYDQVKENYLLPVHYKSLLPIADVEAIKKQIPANVSLSTNSSLVPHFCDRAEIYLFPNCMQANYLLLQNETQDTYPIATETYLRHLFNFKSKDSLGYEIISTNETFTLFKKQTIKN